MLRQIERALAESMSEKFTDLAPDRAQSVGATY
jgi:hypothetical protein